MQNLSQFEIDIMAGRENYIENLTLMNRLFQRFISSFNIDL